MKDLVTELYSEWYPNSFSFVLRSILSKDIEWWEAHLGNVYSHRLSLEIMTNGSSNIDSSEVSYSTYLRVCEVNI